MADLDLEQFEELLQQEQQAKQQEQQAAAAKPQDNGSKSQKDDRPKAGGHHQGSSTRQEEPASTTSKSKPSQGSNNNHEEASADSQSKQKDPRGKKRSSKRRSRSRSQDSHSDARRGRRDRNRRSRSSSDEDKERYERKRQEALQRSLEEAKRQAEEAKRDDCTVLVTRIHFQSDEKEIYKFFTQAKVGKIRDIRIIRDNRGKSKGIAYVEFYTPESVLMALAMSNQQIRGQTIMINASQAEKNRIAAANKYKKSDKNDIPSLGNTLAPRYQHQQRESNNRIYIGGLVGHLATLTQQDIREFFCPFGTIDAIELPKDPYTGKNRGHSIVEFATHKEARVAAESMNGFELMHGQKLKVNILTDGPKAEGANREEDLGEDTTNTYLHSAQDRTALMQKLSRNKDSLIPGSELNPLGGGQSKDQGQAQAQRPTHCLLFQGMFDTTQVDLKKDPSFFMDIKDQVASVCSGFGKIDRIYVEQNSDGFVWVQFKDDDVANATRTLEALDNQLFDGNPIHVQYVSQVDFNAKVKER